MNSYFYIDGNVQKGPVRLDELVKIITPETAVWTQGMVDWVQAKDVQEISALLLSESNVQTVEQVVAVPSTPSSEQWQTAAGNKFYLVPDFHSLLIWSIVSTFLCCNITGVVGIVLNLKAEVEWAKGNQEEAWKKYRNAKTWTIVGAVLGFLFYIIYFFAVFQGVFHDFMRFR